MKVIDVKHVEDCFDGSLIKELLLDTEISKELIFALGEGGDVQYFGHFARPFFKIHVKGLYDLKGIEGNRTMRVHLKSVERFTIEDMCERIAQCRPCPDEQAVSGA
jgi:hypothetical protein